MNPESEYIRVLERNDEGDKLGTNPTTDATRKANTPVVKALGNFIIMVESVLYRQETNMMFHHVPGQHRQDGKQQAGSKWSRDRRQR